MLGRLLRRSFITVAVPPYRDPGGDLFYGSRGVWVDGTRRIQYAARVDLYEGSMDVLKVTSIADRGPARLVDQVRFPNCTGDLTLFLGTSGDYVYAFQTGVAPSLDGFRVSARGRLSRIFSRPTPVDWRYGASYAGSK